MNKYQYQYQYHNKKQKDLKEKVELIRKNNIKKSNIKKQHEIPPLKKWIDEGMVWNPEEYGNITILSVPVAQVEDFFFLYFLSKMNLI